MRWTARVTNVIRTLVEGLKTLKSFLLEHWCLSNEGPLCLITLKIKGSLVITPNCGCSNGAPHAVYTLRRADCLARRRGYGLSPAVSECGSVEQCRSSVGAESGQCRGSVGAVSGQCRLTMVSACRAVSEQCRSSVDQCRGFLTDVGMSMVKCRVVSECRSVGVSSSVGVSGCRSVGVSGGCQVGVRWVIVSSSDEMLWIWMSQ